MKILIIAPHPDDEVLGCGGTIKKWVWEKNEVYLCAVTKGHVPGWTKRPVAVKEKEAYDAAKVLGIKKVFFLDLPAVRLDTIPQKDINNMIAKCIEEVKPEILCIPHKGDLNKDHKIVFEAALVASRPSSDFLIKKVLSYEALSSTEWGQLKINEIDEVFLPNVYIDISDTIKDKLNAMKCYESELRKFPHPRSLKGITVLSEKRGMEVGLKNAEAFMLVRELIK